MIAGDNVLVAIGDALVTESLHTRDSGVIKTWYSRVTRERARDTVNISSW
jgi:hypothetical protein